MRILQIVGAALVCLGALAASTPSPPWLWQQVQGVHMKPDAVLTDVVALGPREVWAAGTEGRSSAAPEMPVIERWDGARWTRLEIGAKFAPRAPSGSAEFDLMAIDVNGPEDLWLVGAAGSGFQTNDTILRGRQR